MRHVKYIVAALLLLSLSLDAGAYKRLTHKWLSFNAAGHSILADKDHGPLHDLGMLAIDDARQKFPNSDGKLMTVVDLIRDGAQHEDDGIKAINHFFDPVRRRGLTFAGAEVGLPSPEWALESMTGGDIIQSFSLPDADKYFYKALVAADESERNKQFGLAFESLGHVIHHLEDMAQPQHVRNDMHCDNYWMCKPFGLFHPSAYEAFTEAHYLTLPTGGYAPVHLNAAQEYWFTSDGGVGSGISEFTNNNFVSVGTNFTIDGDGNPSAGREYKLPVPAGQPESVSVAALYQQLGRLLPPDITALCGDSSDACQVSFYGNTVTDNYLGTTSFNQQAASLSIFDEDLKAKNLGVDYGAVHTTRLFTLNSFNYRADWPYLIPRAVGYGAGLINYFFRGKIDFKPADNGDGWTVKNVGPYAMQGELQVFYDGDDGKRHPVPNADWPNVQLQPGDEQALQFDAPKDPPAARANQYLLVFKGKIGEEQGIAAKQYAVQPDYFYVADRGVLRRYDANQELVDTSPLPNAPNGWCCGITLYGGVKYTMDYGVARRDGVILPGEYGGDNYSDNIAVNSSYVYVSVYNSVHHQDGSYREFDDIYRYDHAGHLLGMTPNPSINYLTGLAANDSRLCISGWNDYPPYDGKAELDDLAGHKLADLPGSGYWGGGACALTKDRLYLTTHDSENGDDNADLSVFDINGNLITSVPIFDVYLPTSMAATDSKVYISIEYDPRIVVFDRVVTKDEDGKIISEKFVREPDVILDHYWYPWVGVDMQQVLHSLSM